MSAFDRGSDGPDDRDSPSEAGTMDNSSLPAAQASVMVESRSRGEAYADLKQRVDSGWDRQRTFDAPRSELAGFRMERAGLTEITQEDADRYVEQNRAERPWLQTAERASPEARRIIAALDQGGGHGHIRHEGWVTEEANMRRTAYLEDPAQLDPDKKHRGIDGLKANNKKHICADLATRITDPDAFAAAFVRGTERTDVHKALATSYDPGERPDPVRVPIADLLGQDGHKLCTGWQLEPLNENPYDAVNNRKEWRAALAEGRQSLGPEPTAQPVPTFEGGELVFVLGHNKAHDGYEIVSMYAEPRDEEASDRPSCPLPTGDFHAGFLLEAAPQWSVRHAHPALDHIPTP